MLHMYVSWTIVTSQNHVSGVLKKSSLIHQELSISSRSGVGAFIICHVDGVGPGTLPVGEMELGSPIIAPNLSTEPVLLMLLPGRTRWRGLCYQTRTNTRRVGY